jgi:hypothetical protein
VKGSNERRVSNTGASCHPSEMGGLFYDKSRRGNAECLENFPENATPKFQKETTTWCACGQGLDPDQVTLISAAVSAGMKQVVCVPAGVSVPGTVGKKVPSGFTVAPWILTPEVAARLGPVIVCSVAPWMF